MREVTEIGAFLLATLAKLQNPRVTFFGSKKKIIKKSIAFYFWPVRGENNLLSVLWLHVLQICTKKCKKKKVLQRHLSVIFHTPYFFF